MTESSPRLEGPADPAAARIGVIGLDVMDLRFARRFMDAGYTAHVYNRTSSSTDAAIVKRPS